MDKTKEYLMLIWDIPAKKRLIFFFGLLMCVSLTGMLYFHNFHDLKNYLLYELGSLFLGLVSFLLFLHLRFKSLADELKPEIRAEIKQDFQREHDEI